MSEEIQKIAASLPDLNDVNKVCDLVKQRVGRGDAAFVADLGIALFNAYGSANTPIWQYSSVFDTILRLLIINAGPEHLGNALRLIGASCASDRKQARYPASLLASNRSAQDLVGIFAEDLPEYGSTEELRICLVHELVMRGEPVDDRSAITGWATSPHWGHHPLRWLPPARSPIEADLTLPDYSVHGHGHAIPFGPAYDQETVPTPPVGNGSVPAAVETTTEETTVLTSRAVENWADESNGRIEARSFALDAPAGSLGDLLPTLNLNCLSVDSYDARVSKWTVDANGRIEARSLALDAPTGSLSDPLPTLNPDRPADDKRRPTVSVQGCDAAHVWRILFDAASTGGAYNRGLHRAYGRLEAWKSMAGLTNSLDTDGFAGIERRVREHRWFVFETSAPWFYQIAWDIGIVALSPDSRTVTVLAATDTD